MSDICDAKALLQQLQGIHDEQWNIEDSCKRFRELKHLIFKSRHFQVFKIRRNQSTRFHEAMNIWACFAKNNPRRIDQSFTMVYMNKPIDWKNAHKVVYGPSPEFDSDWVACVCDHETFCVIPRAEAHIMGSPGVLDMMEHLRLAIDSAEQADRQKDEAEQALRELPEMREMERMLLTYPDRTVEFNKWLMEA